MVSYYHRWWSSLNKYKSRDHMYLRNQANLGNFLLDQKGVIITRGLMEALREKIVELFNKEAKLKKAKQG